MDDYDEMTGEFWYHISNSSEFCSGTCRTAEPVPPPKPLLLMEEP